MLGEAETRVKHAWEGGILRHRQPPPPGTHQASGDFTTTGAGSHTPPGRRLGKETPFSPPHQGPKRLARLPRHVGTLWKGIWAGRACTYLPLPTTSSPLSCPAWEP